MNITYDQKRAIYDSIMKKISVTVKTRLNEAMSTKAENSDGASL